MTEGRLSAWIWIGIGLLVTSCQQGSASSPLASMPPAPIVSGPSLVEARRAAAIGLFAYDADAPLNLDMPSAPTDTRREADSYDVAYDSPSGGRVPAWIVIPHGSGPFPVVLLMHGSGDRRGGMLDIAFDLADGGVASIAIDAPFARPGWESEVSDFVTFTPKDRDDQISLMRDLRRAVDVANEVERLDGERVGYLGISYGAAMGAELAGLEHRIGAYVLAVGDGGLVEHFLGPDDADGSLMSLSEQQRQQWIDAMEPIEPIYFIGGATSPIFLLSARRDRYLPVSDVERFHAAAPAGTRIKWYDTDHELHRDAYCDAVTWLAGYLSFDASATGMCH